MSTEVIVALILTGGTLFGGMLTTILSRRGARDLRVNIDREIDIVKKLQPGSDEVVKLEKHISKSIDNLIVREERRDYMATQGWLFGAGMLVSIAIYALQVWRDHGVPESLWTAANIAYWALWAFWAIFILLALTTIYRTVKPVVTFGVARVAYAWTSWRLQVWLKRTKEAHREFEVRRAYSAYVVQDMEKHKDAIVAEKGQEWWDRKMAERRKIDALGDQVEASFKRHHAQAVGQQSFNGEADNITGPGTEGNPDTGSLRASEPEQPDRP